VLEVEAHLAVREAVGQGTIVPVHGWCFHRERRVRRLRLLVDGQPQVGEKGGLLAHGVPRPDVAQAWEGSAPRALSLRSGFWGLAELPAGNGGISRHRLDLEALLAGGERVRAPIGEVEVVAATSLCPPPPVLLPDGVGAPRIVICMCTYQPRLDLFEAQIESIAGQTVADWACIVNDDGSDPDRLAGIEGILSRDRRFHLRRNRHRLGFYRNHERVLALVPPGVRFVALADQDDRWQPDKIEVLMAELASGAVLAHSDVRVVSAEGQVLAETQWTLRPPNRGELASQLLANSVTGAACLFRSDLLTALLPFPHRIGAPYHDHWLGAVAMALGEVRYVDRPLYDWVHHPDQVTSQTSWVRAERLQARRSLSRLRRVVEFRPRRVRDAFALWRHIYFSEVCRVSLFARMIMQRCEGAMTMNRRRQVERVIAADTSLVGVIILAWRRLRRRAAHSPTWGFETELLLGHLWRRLASAAGRAGLRGPGGPVPPPPVAYGDEMVMTGAAGPPMPPLALAWRVGPLDPADPMADYDRIGKRIHDQLVACLPDDWRWEGKRVLDLGCGAGRVLRHLIGYADVGSELHGCDIDAASIDWLLGHLSPPVHAFTNDPLPPLPMPDGSLDLVIATSVFTHIYQGWSEWLLDLHRVLVPGGLVLATYLGAGMSDELRALTGRPYDPDEMGMLALGCEGHYEWTNVWHTPWWLREHWGRAFEILDLQESGFADRPGKGHGWVLMRSRPVQLEPADLERPAPADLARELRAAELNVAALFKGPSQLLAERDASTMRLAEMRRSMSWRLTGPMRRAASLVRRHRRPTTR
jgi:SAM-dependent methyltransferase/glycosyltransferase involved in cell wall biosynthesis